MLLTDLIIPFKLFLINEKGFSKSTVKRYSLSISKFLRDSGIIYLNEYSDSQINKEFLNKFWESFEDNTIRNTSKSNYIAAIKSFTNFLFLKSYIKNDFSKSLVFPKPEEVFRDGFTDEEQKLIREYLFKNLNTEKGRRDAAMFITYSATGMRVSEGLSLRVDDRGIIDFSKGDRCGSFEYYDGHVWVRIHGKGHRERVVVLDPVAVKYVNYHLKNRKLQSPVVFNNVKNNTNDNKLLSIVSANSILQDICSAVGIERDVTTHIFRHTAVVTWLNDGVNTKRIISMLGQASEAALEPYYKRDRSLIKLFAGKSSMLKKVKLSSKQRQFEEMMG